MGDIQKAHLYVCYFSTLRLLTVIYTMLFTVHVPVLLQRTIQALLQGGAGRVTIYTTSELVVSANIRIHQTDMYIYVHKSYITF